jgi:signal transduction histidine kinase
MQFRILFLTFLFGVFQCGAQEFFGHLWLEEGLSQSSVTGITQDEQGFMWFSTQDGLNRYDGKQIDRYNFQPFNNTSISGDNLDEVQAGPGNKLWVLSGAGLDRFDPLTFKAENISGLWEEEKDKKIMILKIWVRNGRTFAWTPRGFCELQQSKQNKFSVKRYGISRDPLAKRMFAKGFCIAKNGDFYLGTNEGVFKCPAGLTEFSDYQPDPEISFARECLNIFSSGEKIYFALGNDFYSCNPSTGQVKSFNTGVSIMDAVADNKNTFWLGTWGNGIYRLSENSAGNFILQNQFKDNPQNKYGLTCNFINTLYQAPGKDEDVMWIGSRDAGVFTYNYSKNSFQLPSSLLDKPSLNFFGMVKDSANIIWAGTNNGIYKIDRAGKTSAFINIAGLTEKAMRPVEAMHIDEEGTIWAGLGNALYKINAVKNSFDLVLADLAEQSQNIVLRIISISPDELMIGTRRGYCIYNKKKNSKEFISEIIIDGKSVKTYSVGALYPDKSKNLWIGTTAGLFLIDKKSGRNKCFAYDRNNTKGLLSPIVMDIRETEAGEILVATTKGLSILKNQGTGEFENYYSAPGLTNNFIYGLLPDKKGNFWLSTNHGIAIFNPAQRSFKSYRGKDGLHINEFNSGGFYVAADGEMLFGGLGGLVTFYPERMVTASAPPKVILRSFRIDEQESDSLLAQKKLPALRLSHSQNNLFFEFSVPYFAGGDVQLVYKLLGVDKDWNTLGTEQRFLSYVNLAPGEYELNVKAINSNGVESSEPFSLKFKIHPPFWQSAWFYVLAIAALLIFSWLLYRNRLNKKIETLRELERVRKEENERVRKAAALDLHDEFGNGLTRINMLVETAKMKIPDEQKELRDILQVISENSLRLYQGTKDFIWSINPGNDNLYESIIRIKDFGDELFFNSGTDFKVEGLDERMKEIRHLPGTGRNMVMIFKEGLSNVTKHAGANKVRLTVEMIGSGPVLRLEDNGKGFNGEKKSGFGLGNMQQRAQRIGAVIEINSSKEKGTELKLKLKQEKTN